MKIKLIDKDTMQLAYKFEVGKQNIVVLDGKLYELTNEEYVKFTKGEYMKEHLKSYIEDFDLDLYTNNASYNLDEYVLIIE